MKESLLILSSFYPLVKKVYLLFWSVLVRLSLSHHRYWNVVALEIPSPTDFRFSLEEIFSGFFKR